MTMLTFGPTVLQQNVTVRLIDDPLYEGREDFSLMLTTSDSGVTLAPSQANFTIIDNEGESCSNRNPNGSEVLTGG